MIAARTTSAREKDDMRPPCRAGAEKISTSPPLGFCPSGAAACYRGFRNARTGDGAAVRNPSCHSVDRFAYVPRRQPRQPGSACDPMQLAPTCKASACEVQQLRRAAQQHAAAFRRDQGKAVIDTGETECDQLVHND